MLLRNVAKTDLTEVSTRFPQFAEPVTLVWGQGDRCFKPSLGRRMAELFPNSSLIEVADAKTFVSLDDPQAVIEAIAAGAASS
jgi:pimeloyl-ACP methyl ester carboxylesterase